MNPGKYYLVGMISRFENIERLYRENKINNLWCMNNIAVNNITIDWICPEKVFSKIYLAALYMSTPTETLHSESSHKDTYIFIAKDFAVNKVLDKLLLDQHSKYFSDSLSVLETLSKRSSQLHLFRLQIYAEHNWRK